MPAFSRPSRHVGSFRSTATPVPPTIRGVLVHLRVHLAVLREGGRLSALLWGFSGQMAVSATALAGSIFVARLLGPSGRGEFGILTLTGVTAAFVFSFGIPYGLARAQLTGHANAIVTSAAIHAAAVVPVAGLLWLVIPSIFAVSPSLLAVVLFGIVPINVLVADIGGGLLSAKAMKAMHSARLLSVGTFSAGLGLLILIEHPSVAGALWLFAAGSLAALLAQLVVAVPRWGVGAPLPARELRTLSARNYGGMLAEGLLARADQFIVAAVSGSAAVGVYGVAVNVSEVGQYLGNAIGASVVEDRSSLPDRDVIRIAVISAVAVAGLMVPVLLASWLLVGPVFGENFASARIVAILLAPGIVARAITVSVFLPLMARGEGRTCSIISGAVLIVGIAAWYAGAELGGINGAAFANSCVYLLQAALFLAVPFLAVRRESSQSV